MKYIKLEFSLSEDFHEQFIAELLDLDFYGFEQFDDKLVAYVEASRFNDTNREYIEQITGAFPGASFSEITEIEEQNWNRAWEETIKPQRIGPFLVKPTWSKESAGSDEILLEIDPKMSFGTGYHATTRLMLRQIGKLDLNGKKVMDAGTGTGILAIAAVKVGAANAIGFDTDPWCQENAYENVLVNKVEKQVDIRIGGIEQIKKSEMFDCILANINRNVILEIIPFLIHHTKTGGTICLSGLLESDEEIVREKLSGEPVHVVDMQQEEEWILFQIEKLQG
jgi:ribosomal protein L11 methyltransferase